MASQPVRAYEVVQFYRPQSLSQTLAVYISVLLAVFNVGGVRWPIAIISACVVCYSIWKCGHTLTQLGLSFEQIRGSAYVVEWSLGAAIVMIGIAWFSGTLNHTVPIDLVIGKKIGYIAGTLCQQFLLRNYFFPPLSMAYGERKGVWMTVSLFSLAHFPNIPLMTATIVIAWLSLRLLLWHRQWASGCHQWSSLWCVGIAHAILAVSFSMAVPADVHRNMRVGKGWFTYQSEKPAPVLRIRSLSH